ncbi:MAG TPA: hypothetical protein DCS30_04720 [Rhizobiales bacterium]|nr:hypothetical protein [Hyphomicrobiales bacterium]
MRFSYSSFMQQAFPDRSTAILRTTNIYSDLDVTAAVVGLTARATQRLTEKTEGAFVEIQAWRRAYSAMGLKPTQYRCASEALLRRLRKDGALPSLHPLIDLCNAASAAYAVPVAVFDLDHVAGDLCVRQADGSERYHAFSGAIENPDIGEVIFADDQGNAHARRWANRQSRLSAVSHTTSKALIVAEALHEKSARDVDALSLELSDILSKAIGTLPETALLLTPDADYCTQEVKGVGHVG